MSSTSVKNILLSQPKIGQNGASTPALQHSVTTTDEATVVEIEVPGVDPATISVNCEGPTLTVDCARGRFTMPIDPSTDASKISADILWGMLTLTVPLPPSPSAQSIKVNVVGQSAPAKKPATTQRFTEKD